MALNNIRYITVFIKKKQKDSFNFFHTKKKYLNTRKTFPSSLRKLQKNVQVLKLLS